MCSIQFESVVSRVNRIPLAEHAIKIFDNVAPANRMERTVLCRHSNGKNSLESRLIKVIQLQCGACRIMITKHQFSISFRKLKYSGIFKPQEKHAVSQDIT